MNKIVKKKKLWLSLGITSVALLAVSIVGECVCSYYESVISYALNLKTFDIVKGDNKDENTMYYSSAYDSEESLVAHEEELCANVMEEGAVLLKNDNNALPLVSGSNVSLFSQSSVRPVYGGTGSGQVNVAAAPTFQNALKNEGINVNSTLWKFYESGDGSKYSRSVPSTTESKKSDYAVGEVPWKVYGNAVKNSFASYGDAAIVMLSRSGGEGCDLAKKEGKDSIDGDYLRLNQDEIDLLTNLKSYKDNGTFKKIIVLFNTSNMIQLDFLDDYGIDAAMWIGDIGVTGINGVARLLSGKTNPSGRTVETYLKDNKASPTYINFGANMWTNLSDYVSQLGNDPQAKDGYYNNAYNVYQEGIYVGYRYYETRYYDYVKSQGNAGNYQYSDVVAYPFGYGLSYTTFEYTSMESKETEDGFEFTVSVKNTGDVAGKHTVQIYMEAPYTQYDKDNNVEKSAVKLVGFEKSGLISAGKEEKVTVKVDKKELASYDSNNAKTYIVDAGTYRFTVASDAHKAVNNFLASESVTTSSSTGRMDENGVSSLVYSDYTVSSLDTTTYSKSEYTGKEITNQFDNVDVLKYDGIDSTDKNNFKYMTRSDWEGTFPKTTASLKVTKQMTEEGLILGGSNREGEIYSNLVERYKKEYQEKFGEVKEMPKTGVNSGLTVAMLKDTPMDDDKWDLLIQQMSVDELLKLVTQGFHCTVAVSSTVLPATKNENGPQGLTASLVGGSSAMCYTSEDILAATYNRELTHDVGSCMGEDCLYGGYSGMYAPGTNIHRSNYEGRSFEYYSEDGYLSGEIGYEVTNGIASKGVLVQMKHFALNEQEDYRNGICTFANEQSIREIYLKSFEKPLANQGQLVSVMSSFNRLGVRWSGAHMGLMTGILSDEWNVTGSNITDCSTTRDYMDGVLGILSGTTLWDGSGQQAVASLTTYSNDKVVVKALQNAAKSITQSIASGNGMNGISSSDKLVNITPFYLILLPCLIGLFGLSTIVCFTFFILGIIDKKKNI
jgi:beta-glucosidase